MKKINFSLLIASLLALLLIVSTSARADFGIAGVLGVGSETKKVNSILVLKFYAPDSDANTSLPYSEWSSDTANGRPRMFPNTLIKGMIGGVTGLANPNRLKVMVNIGPSFTEDGAVRATLSKSGWEFTINPYQYPEGPGTYFMNMQIRYIDGSYTNITIGFRFSIFPKDSNQYVSMSFDTVPLPCAVAGQRTTANYRSAWNILVGGLDPATGGIKPDPFGDSPKTQCNRQPNPCQQQPQPPINPGAIGLAGQGDMNDALWRIEALENKPAPVFPEVAVTRYIQFCLKGCFCYYDIILYKGCQDTEKLNWEGPGKGRYPIVEYWGGAKKVVLVFYGRDGQRIDTAEVAIPEAPPMKIKANYEVGHGTVELVAVDVTVEGGNQ